MTVRVWCHVLALGAAVWALGGALTVQPGVDAAAASAVRSTSPTAAGVAGKAAVTSAANQDDPAAISFDEYSLGSTITDDYASMGVIFTSDVFTATDRANETSPVLSGTPKFYGDITGYFSVPGTATPTTVNGFSLDVGYINDRNSVEIDYYDAAGSLVGTTRAQSYGINEITVTYRGVASFKVRAVEEEAAGFAIDNLIVQRAARGIHPTRMAEFGDSYSSGEGLLPEKGLHYDCGTDLHEGRYVKGTTVPAFFPVWTADACQTASGSKHAPKDLGGRGDAVYENLCHRHRRAYPNQIRERLGIAGSSSIFLACSGATTANVGARGVASAQYPNSPPGVHGGKSQLETALDFATGGAPELITIGIGGNDANFAAIVGECIVHTCSDPDFASRAISTVNGSMYSNVRSTFSGLRTAFPGATIAAFGYPSVVDDPANTCRRAFRIGSDELSWIKYTLLPTINDAVKDAAAEAGAVYVDVTAATAGHGVCSQEPWVNGVRFGDDALGGLIGNESFHPSQKAHDSIASLFIDHFTDGAGTLLVGNPSPEPPIRGAVGPEIRLGSIDVGAVRSCGAGCLQPTACVQSCPINVQGGGFDPGATMTVTLQSDPVLLGTVTADANGEVNATFKAPKGLDAGLHSVTLDGIMASGVREHSVQSFRVFSRPRTKLGLKLRREGRQVVVRSLRVKRAPPGTRLDIVCVKAGGRAADRALAGRRVGRRNGCPFSHRHFSLGKGKRKTASGEFARLFKMPLSRRTIVRVVTAAAGKPGKVLDAVIRRNGRVKIVRRCTEPGQIVPVRC